MLFEVIELFEQVFVLLFGLEELGLQTVDLFNLLGYLIIQGGLGVLELYFALLLPVTINLFVDVQVVPQLFRKYKGTFHHEV